MSRSPTSCSNASPPLLAVLVAAVVIYSVAVAFMLSTGRAFLRDESDFLRLVLPYKLAGIALSTNPIVGFGVGARQGLTFYFSEIGALVVGDYGNFFAMGLIAQGGVVGVGVLYLVYWLLSRSRDWFFGIIMLFTLGVMFSAWNTMMWVVVLTLAVALASPAGRLNARNAGRDVRSAAPQRSAYALEYLRAVRSQSDCA